ncbi:MAG: histidine phosphatase family protein [Acidimicrobiales bacterium]
MLIVVRHGRTTVNAAGLLLGRADPPLDDVGRDQARAVAAAIGPVDRVVSSPLARCRSTAAEFVLPVEVDDRWIELDYGDWDGRPLAGVPAEAWNAWRADNDFSPPGGETLSALGRRVRAAATDLAEEAQERAIVVVTHVSPTKALLAWALGVGDEIAWRAFVAPASVTRIAVGERGPSLVGFNDTGHLERRRD